MSRADTEARDASGIDFARVRSLAVLPARGGSKRIPMKNIQPFGGRPILAWPIEAARASSCFDAIVVSTDDATIAATARMHGALAPFRRPDELADDHTPLRSVLTHARDWFLTRGAPLQWLAGILPTAPFLAPERIRRSFEALEHGSFRRAFLAARFSYPVQRGFTIEEDGGPRMLFPDRLDTRSQDLAPVFHDAGQFYLHRLDDPRPEEALAPVLTSEALPIVVPAGDALDIDSEEDWRLAEEVFLARRALRGDA